MPRLYYDPANDYYALLGVPVTATAQEIKQAFHRLAKELHPDRNPERQDWATTAFQDVNEAYAVLSNPGLRRQYDSLRWPHSRHRAEADPYRRASTNRAGGSSTAETYAEWLRQYYADSSDPVARAYAARTPWASIMALLRGPFGYIYLLAGVIFVMFFGSFFLIDNLAGYARDAHSAAAISPTVTLAVGTAVSSPVPAILPGALDTTCANPLVNLDTPANDSVQTGPFWIVGTAAPAGMRDYHLELAYLGLVPSDETLTDPAWTVIGETSSQPVISGTLGRVEAVDLAAPGTYAVRLVVVLEDGRVESPCARTLYYSDQ